MKERLSLKNVGRGLLVALAISGSGGLAFKNEAAIDDARDLFASNSQNKDNNSPKVIYPEDSRYDPLADFPEHKLTSDTPVKITPPGCGCNEPTNNAS